MNFMHSYIKKVGKKIIFLGLAIMVLMATSLVIIFTVNGFKMLHATIEEILMILIFSFALPTIIGGVVTILPFFKTYYQINKYLCESSEENRQELNILLKRECTDKEAKWHFQARYSERFMVLLPNVVIKKDELASCNRFGTRSYGRAGTYYRVKFILKSGKKKVIDFPTITGVDTTLRWWKQN